MADDVEFCVQSAFRKVCERLEIIAMIRDIKTNSRARQYKSCKIIFITRLKSYPSPGPRGGGGTRVYFGWVCAARVSKFGPRFRKNLHSK